MKTAPVKKSSCRSIAGKGEASVGSSRRWRLEAICIHGFWL
jgi:hypothetical protein